MKTTTSKNCKVDTCVHPHVIPVIKIHITLVQVDYIVLFDEADDLYTIACTALIIRNVEVMLSRQYVVIGNHFNITMTMSTAQRPTHNYSPC
jgi:hypothetical protein